MAVPKKKTSTSRRNKRRSHHALGSINVVEDKETGEYRLPHRICKIHKTYNKRLVVESNTSQETK